MTTVAQIADVQLGKMLDRAKNRGNPTAYLRNVNVRWGELDLSNLQDMRFTDSEMEFFDIRDGDLIVCEGGEPGRSAIWRNGPTDLKYQKALHRVRTHPGILPEYLGYFLRHAANAGLLEPLLTGSTIKHLPRTALLRLSLPLPPTGEQRRIVGKLASLFERTRCASEAIRRVVELGASGSREIGLLGNLERAILAKAFRGELVPQNPADEPASVLLERIRKERADEQPNRRTRHSRSTTGQETTT